MLRILAHRRQPEVLPSHTNHSHPTLQTHSQGAIQSKARGNEKHAQYLRVASCWGLLHRLPRCQPHGPACLHSRHLLRQTALPDLVFCQCSMWQRHLVSCCLPPLLGMWQPEATLQFQGLARSQVRLCTWFEQPVQQLTTSSAHWLSAQPACYLRLWAPALQ